MELILGLHWGLGEAYFKLKNYKQSDLHMDTALQIIHKHHYEDWLMDYYQDLGNWENEKGNFKAALHYYKKEQALKDSIWTKEKQLAFEELSLSFEAEQKEQKNKLLEQEKHTLTLRNRLLSFIVLLSLSGICAMIFFYIKDKKKNRIIARQKQEQAQLYRARKVREALWN